MSKSLRSAATSSSGEPDAPGGAKTARVEVHRGAGLGDGAQAVPPQPEERDGYTAAPWEDERIGKANQLLTVDALEILQKAGRL